MSVLETDELLTSGEQAGDDGLPPATLVRRAADEISLCPGDPAIEVHEDCVYVPLRGGNFWTNPNWGIYHSDGRVVDAAAYRSASRMAMVGQSETCPLDISQAVHAPGDTYFYVGNVIPHYGHFICSTMSRLWALPRCGGASLPLLGHAEGDPAHWFKHPVVSSLFGLANVIREDFAHFDRPTRIRRLIVARPAFIEKNICHETFATCAHHWGDRLAKTQDITTRRGMVYLSKSKYRTSPDGLSNETEITSELERLGVDIAYPELLSLSEQVALFRTTRVIMGQVGSAFHTSVFSAPAHRQKIINIALSPDVYSSNHALIDLANGNNSEYVYFPGEIHPRDGANPGFRIHNPRGAARRLVEFAQRDGEDASWSY